MHKKIALFPGSFDPFTKGHEHIVQKALTLFDKVVIGVGVNQEKKYCFPLHKRLEHIKSIFEQNPNVMVKSYSSLTTVFAKEVNANYLIRGLRNANDFTYEQSIALINKQMNGIESIFFITDPAFMALSATIVREIFKTGEKIDGFVTNSSILVNE